MTREQCEKCYADEEWLRLRNAYWLAHQCRRDDEARFLERLRHDRTCELVGEYDGCFSITPPA
jgi:hypothetical protein